MSWKQEPTIEVQEKEFIVQNAEYEVVLGARKAKKGSGTPQTFALRLWELPPASIAYVIGLGCQRALGTTAKGADVKLADLKSGNFRTRGGERLPKIKVLSDYLDDVLAERSPKFRKLKRAERAVYVAKLEADPGNPLHKEASRRLTASSTTAPDVDLLDSLLPVSTPSTPAA